MTRRLSLEPMPLPALALALLATACFDSRPARADNPPRGAVQLTDKVEQASKRVMTEPGDLPRLKVAVDGKSVALPLQHTAVDAQVEGDVARVEVSQTYGNPYPHPIEALYVFPLPENSAVDGMTIVIGERVIEAEIQKRADAKRTYETAKQQGHTAALLEQERPNVFTQSVANIAPGKTIRVVIRYLQNMSYDSGEYELVFPMVVGPRFIPGSKLDGKPAGAGGSADTDLVPDASRISPPILGHGMRSGHDISLQVSVRAAGTIKAWDVPTHEVKQTGDNGLLRLALAPHDSLPNRDFVLRYSVAGDKPAASVLTETTGSGSYLSLIVQPPKLDVDKLVGQRELIFVVDVSGSMHGVPLAMCQDAMREALRKLRPLDTFNIYSFSGSTGSAFKAPMPANDNNIKEGLDYIVKLRAGGGTQMADAIKAALETDVERGRTRHVFFMTDGYVGNEEQILQMTERYVKSHSRDRNQARVFGFGVGSSVNRHLLDGLGKYGNGLTVYSTTREDPVLSVNKFFHYIDSPVLEDVSIDWNGLPVTEVYPRVTPDLFASHPLTLHARMASGAGGTIYVRGKMNGKTVELPVQVSAAEKAPAKAIATLWARSKISDLERGLLGNERQQATDGITQLGLDYKIVTAFTSFVAVDRTSKVEGPAKTIVQPVEAPEGVDASMAGGHLLQTAKLGASYGSFSGSATGGGGLGIGGIGLQGSGRGGSGYGSAAGSGLRKREAPAPAAQAEQERRDQRTHNEGALMSPKDDADKAAPVKPAEPKAKAAQRFALELSGAIDEAAVRAFIERQHGLLGQCSERTGASVTLTWFVAADGSVLQAKISSATDSSSKLQACVLAQVKRWKLPPPSGTAQLTLTLFL